VANIRSQKQRVLTNERDRQINASVKSELKTHIKTAASAIEAKDKDVSAKISLAQSKLASAASKGRLNKRAAARKTSRLMKKANA
jgi:small subunit ribosomal protein S20